MKFLIPMLCALPFVAACASGPSKADLDDEVRRLCAIDGGIKVYETVRLPAEKFDPYGNVRVPSKARAKPKDEYFFEREQTNDHLHRAASRSAIAEIAFRSGDRHVAQYFADGLRFPLVVEMRAETLRDDATDILRRNTRLFQHAGQHAA